MTSAITFSAFQWSTWAPFFSFAFAWAVGLATRRPGWIESLATWLTSGRGWIASKEISAEFVASFEQEFVANCNNGTAVGERAVKNASNKDAKAVQLHQANIQPQTKRLYGAQEIKKMSATLNILSTAFELFPTLLETIEKELADIKAKNVKAAVEDGISGASAVAQAISPSNATAAATAATAATDVTEAVSDGVTAVKSAISGPGLTSTVAA
ncbi:MAG: hypothetical protein P4K78_10770 [Terracidiphilus sp.]|nr:hypothetical protein [Terracidiphilus sp.]